ncbi:hypothetical protein SRHO_G00197180 [Serrasalmus rhombeus]
MGCKRRARPRAAPPAPGASVPEARDLELVASSSHVARKGDDANERERTSPASSSSPMASARAREILTRAAVQAVYGRRLLKQGWQAMTARG